MAKELAKLVISGKKIATASLVEFNEKHPEVAPMDEGYSRCDGFSRQSFMRFQTTEIRHLPFDEVDAEYCI